MQHASCIVCFICSIVTKRSDFSDQICRINVMHLKL